MDKAPVTPKETAVASDSIRQPDTDSIQYAVSRLLKEPETVTLGEESDEAAEPEAEEEHEAPDTDSEEESEGEDSNSDPDDDSSEDDDTGDEDEGEDRLEYYTVKIDGEELEVTFDELRSGYQRQKDYTKKTQALSEQRKVYEAKASEIEQLQQTFIHQATLANEVLNRDLKKFENVNWDEMKLIDPVGFVQKQIEIQDIQNRQRQLQQQAQEAYEHNQKVRSTALEQHLELQRKEALKLFPDWKDADKAAQGQLAIVEYAKKLGYTDAALSRVTDAIDLQLLDKARRYDELMSKRKGLDKKQSAPVVRKVLKSSGPAPKNANHQKSISEKRGNLRKSGSLKDAAALMAEMRSSKEVRKSRG